LAALAVHRALQEIDASLAGSVLLFLTSHFCRNTQAAISAAARAAHCLQVVGCTAPGVFTENEWSLSAPAAAALVLCGDTGLVAPIGNTAVLTLLTPDSARHSWPSDVAPHVGLLCADPDSDTPGRVWIHGRVSLDGRCDASFSHAKVAAGVSRGLCALSGTMEVTASDGYDLFAVDGEPALSTLLGQLPPELQAINLPPLSQLFAAITNTDDDTASALKYGRYSLVPIIGVSQDEQSLTLAVPLAVGDHLFWVLRQPAVAERDSSDTLDSLATTLPTPDFALMFACIGRGPYFFGSEDRDLELIDERFPGLPVIGAYGAGEIAPLIDCSGIISYSAVIALVDCVHA
jgi:small ligand-binding sensory domain FIST